ncbi:VWA domain-containing protein [Bacillus marasmi]|uniref:VWA domain-containing protein n=1 Tax=Bacillus marasmi TaxID=1926279 RepID=UPI0011C80BAB|nr:VWA domain-containing protein [Bacillus marasmi]
MNIKSFALFLCLLLLVSFTLFGCSAEDAASKSEKESENTNNVQEEKDEGTEVAQSIKDILKENPGKYSGTKYNKAIVHKELNESNFQDKDSFQIYNALLALMREGENYRPYYKFFEKFNPEIETKISQIPGGMKLNKNGEVALNANIAILLDASGSMAQQVGGRSKMDLAKEAINNFVASMPEGANVSLRVYGHKGSNSDSDKELSCGSTELVYDLKAYNQGEFSESLGSFQPTGWTPIAKAINEAKADFEKADKPGQNIIYVVSDGVETCDGDPVQAAKSLHDSEIEAVVNIIGFNVDSAGQKQLLEVAQAGGGEFETVDSAEDFNRIWEDERRHLWNEWWDWSNKNWNKVWDEQNKKSNNLWEKNNKFGSLAYDEQNRLSEAAYYLNDQEQISYDIRVEVDSLIDQRYEIIKKYQEENYESLKDELKTNGENLKNAIKEKGEEMKKKYED